MGSSRGVLVRASIVIDERLPSPNRSGLGCFRLSTARTCSESARLTEINKDDDEIFTRENVDVIEFANLEDAVELQKYYHAFSEKPSR